MEKPILYLLIKIFGLAKNVKINVFINEWSWHLFENFVNQCQKEQNSIDGLQEPQGLRPVLPEASLDHHARESGHALGPYHPDPRSRAMELRLAS
jgi:hypothetical protein